jgi:hypothetical protein
MANSLRPKNVGRKSSNAKPRRSTIEAVVNTIIPFMETEPGTRPALLDKQVDDDRTHRYKEEKSGLNKR